MPLIERDFYWNITNLLAGSWRLYAADLGLFIDDDRVEEKGRIEMEEEVARSPFSSLLGLTVRIIDVGDDHPANELTNARCASGATSPTAGTPRKLQRPPQG